MLADNLIRRRARVIHGAPETLLPPSILAVSSVVVHDRAPTVLAKC
jgi:hypothetical protein